MGGQTSKIQMISNALVLLGDAPIADLSGNGAGSVAGANLYESAYTGLLSNHRWRFATKYQELTKLAASPDTDDYKYQYQLPSDYLLLIKVSAIRDFEIYGDKIYSNTNHMKLDYIYRVDEDNLPPYFQLTMQFMLASLLAIPVTGNSTRADEYRLQYEAQLKRAKFQDASSRPNQPIQHSPFVQVRY
jgi:hypothetical protein